MANGPGLGTEAGQARSVHWEQLCLLRFVRLGEWRESLTNLLDENDFTVPEHRLLFEHFRCMSELDEGLAWHIARTMQDANTGLLDADLSTRCVAALDAAEAACRADDGEICTPEYGARQLRASSVLRSMQRTMLPILAASYDCSALEHAAMVKRLQEACELAGQRLIPEGDKASPKAVDLWQAQKQKIDEYGAPQSAEMLCTYPLAALQQSFGAWRRQAIYVIGGASGSGKSCLMGLIAHNIASHGFRALVVNLEYGREVALERLACQMSGVTYRMDGKYSSQDLERIVAAGDALPDGLEMTDHEAMGGQSHWDAIKQYIWAEHRKRPFDAILIDYYQDIGPGPVDEKKKLADAVWLRNVSQSLRRMSQKLNCAVFVAAVLTDDHERSKELPGNNSIKYSKQLGADAWGIMLLHAPKLDEEAAQMERFRGRRDMTLCVTKSRSGLRTNHPITFKPGCMVFEDANVSTNRAYS